MPTQTICNRYENNDVYCWFDGDVYQLRFFTGMQSVSDLVKQYNIFTLPRFEDKASLESHLVKLEAKGFRVADLLGKLRNEPQEE